MDGLRILLVACAGAALSFTGCSSVGPATLKTNRADYNKALQESGNQQLLLNMVRLLYREPILFLEVNSVAASHSFGASSSSSAAWNPMGWTNLGLGVGATYSDTPTVSYAPLQGALYANRVLSEVDMNVCTRLYHSGWSIETLMMVLVERIGDLPNRPQTWTALDKETNPYRQFLDVARLWRTLQDRGDLAFAMVPGKDVVLSDVIPAEEVKAGALISADKDGYRYARRADGKYELRKAGPASLVVEARYADEKEADAADALLKVKPARVKLPDGRIATRIRLTRFTDAPSAEGPGAPVPDVAIRLRSFLDVLFYLAQGIEAPSSDVESGVIKARKDDKGALVSRYDLMKSIMDVQSSVLPPSNSFVSVYYRGVWFYIKDNDLSSKNTFALLGIIFSIQSGDVSPNQPVLTIPVGR